MFLFPMIRIGSLLGGIAPALQGLAAIDQQGSCGDVASLIRGQESHGHVFRLADPPQGDALAETFQPLPLSLPTLARLAKTEPGINNPWTNYIHTDAIGGSL